MNNNFSTIWISKINKEKLNDLRKKVKKIVRKNKITYDEIVSILLCIRPLDQQLSDMILEG